MKSNYKERRNDYQKKAEAAKNSGMKFTTVSGEPIEMFYGPEDTNKRFHYLLNHGQTGLSVAFDLPTLMGWDSDSPMSEGEVGICGVSISSLEDMEILFDTIPLNKVSTSMTINSPAAMIFAFYLAVAKKQNVDLKNLRGTLQND